MKIIRECSIILIICCLGEAIHSFLNLTIPGNVIGMILLLLALCTGIIKVKSVENVSNFLLKNLAFFFVPAAVGLMTCLSIISKNLLSLFLVIIISTVVVILTTGVTVQLIKRGR